MLKRSGQSPTDAAALIVLLSAVVYIPFYFAFCNPGNLILVTGSELVIQGLVQGVLVGFCSVWFYSTATDRLSASTVAAASSTAPAIVCVLAVPILSEVLDWGQAGAILLMIAGALVTIFGAKEGSPHPELSASPEAACRNSSDEPKRILHD